MTLSLTDIVPATKLSLDASTAVERRFMFPLGSEYAVSWYRAADGSFDEPQALWSQLTGQNFDEQAGMGWLAAVHPSDRARVEKAWRENTARGALSTSYRLRDAMGRWRDIAEHSTITNNADGLAPRAICIAEDIGGSDFAALHDSALDGVDMGAWEVDLVQGSLACSAKCKSIHGRNPLSSFTLSEFALAVSATDRELLFSQASRALCDGQRFTVEYQICLPESSPRWARVQGRRAPGTLGETRLRGVCEDITNAKMREDSERERCEKAAMKSERMAKLLSMLGDELRNPLAPIRNGLQTLRSRDWNPAERDRLRALIERHVSHMAHLINDLRDVARVECGELRLRSQTFDARDALQVAIEECMPLIEAKRHAITVAGLDQPAIFHGDPTRLAQMAANLLNNAAKYTAVGGEIGLKISTSAGRLHVCVSDNGVGLEHDSLERVFDMFEQGGEHHRPSDGGLGIGLALTRKLAELHGGTVTASSAGLGQGCRFLIDLPLGEGAQ